MHQPPRLKRGLHHLEWQEGDAQTNDSRFAHHIEIGGPQPWLETNGLTLTARPHQRIALAHRIFGRRPAQNVS